MEPEVVEILMRRWGMSRDLASRVAPNALEYRGGPYEAAVREAEDTVSGRDDPRTSGPGPNSDSYKRKLAENTASIRQWNTNYAEEDPRTSGSGPGPNAVFRGPIVPNWGNNPITPAEMTLHGVRAPDTVSQADSAATPGAHYTNSDFAAADARLRHTASYNAQLQRNADAIKQYVMEQIAAVTSKFTDIAGPIVQPVANLMQTAHPATLRPGEMK